MVEWLKEKWERIVGVIAGILLALFAAFSIMLRSRKQKEILDHANKSHEAENRVNLDAMKELDSGLTDISEIKDKKSQEINDKFESDVKDLKKDKENVAKEVKEAGDLGKKLADAIGADFVETDD